MNQKPKPYKGQIVYSLNVGDGARGRKSELVPVIVTKVGHKYFTTGKVNIDGQYRSETSYHLDDWREVTNCGCAWTKLYLDKKEYEDERLTCDIRDRISRFSDHIRRGCLIPLDVLKQIDALIAPYAKEDLK